MARFHHAEMADLAKQLTYLSVKVRLEQVNRAERLVCLVEPGKSYPYEFVCYQITGYRARGGIAKSLHGQSLREDLIRLVEQVSGSLKVPIEAVGEPVLSIREAAKHFNVATKTIQRWRRQGLVSRKFVGPDGRLRIGFLKSTLDRFASRHASRVRAAGQFARLTPEERREIIRRARRLAMFCHCCLFEVSKRIAHKLGRAIETVRQTIKEYDRQHPGQKLFPGVGEPLQNLDRHLIYQAHLRGVGVHALAKRFCRTRSSIYRIITEERGRELLTESIEYIPSPEFERPDADPIILGSRAAESARMGEEERRPSPPKGLPIYLKNLYKTGLLTKDEEQAFFRRYNYLKFKAAKVQQRLRGSRVLRADDLRDLEHLIEESNRLKNRLIQSNLRLVVNIAKRHAGPQSNLFELISDGNLSLMRAVDKFDYRRGFKFSTYASWAIMKNFARSVPKEGVRRDRFVTGRDELLEMSRNLRFAGEAPYEEPDITVRRSIERVLDQLTSRDREVVKRRFGLGDAPGPQTLEEVGKHFGVTKERIRQIETRALHKLRGLIKPEALEEVNI